MLFETLKKISDSSKHNKVSLCTRRIYETELNQLGWNFFNEGSNKLVWQHPDYNFLLKTGYTVLSEARKYGELPVEIQEKCAKVYLAGEIEGLEFSLVERIKGREMFEHELEDKKSQISELLKKHDCEYSFEWRYWRNVMLTETNDFRFIDLS